MTELLEDFSDVVVGAKVELGCFSGVFDGAPVDADVNNSAWVGDPTFL